MRTFAVKSSETVSLRANVGRRATGCLALGCLVSLLAATAAPASEMHVTVDGSRAYQTIEGFGVNANHRSWNNNELKPVLDALIDQAGMTLFRVIYDKANWEASNDNSDPNVMNWTYYNQVYRVPEFQKMWDMSAYLNQRGISNGLMFNFQGNGPAWMGGSPLTAGYEAEWAEMVASMFIYARKTRHLQFTLVGPNNEEDILIQGVNMTASQYVTALHKLAQLLDTNGLSDVRFVGPDLGYTSTDWLSAMMDDPTIMAKLAHFGLHSYEDNGGGSTGIYDFLRQSAYPDRTFWMTEYNFPCSSCEAGVGGDSSWAYAKSSVSYLLNHLANGASAGLVWEGYDSQYNYYAPGQWSYWGLFAVNNIHAVPKTYTPRKTFYTLSQISKFVRPGAQRIDVSGGDSQLSLLAFYHPDTRHLTLTGINHDTSPATLSGTLTHLPGIANLDLYYTTSTTNLARGASVPVANGGFSAVAPADSVFTLTSILPPSITISAQPEGGVVRNGGTATLNVVATGTSSLTYQWQRNRVNIPGATSATLTLTNVRPVSSAAADAGTYRVVITSAPESLTSSNAVLLVDRKLPIVTVSAPKAGARLTNDVLSVSGKASDDTWVTGVFYQMNGTGWSPATGTSNWSATVNLTAGTNIFQAYATDAAGSYSSTNTVRFTFVRNSPLSLVTNGLGSITGNFKGNLLEIGRGYTVKAVPGTGQVFSNWVGSVTSGSAVLNFVMQSNMVLQANFIPNPFLRAKGTYNGLFYEPNRAHDHSGFFTLALSAGGSYSAKLQVGTTSYSTAGQFMVAGTSSQTVARRGMGPWTLTMALDLAGAQQLTGSVGDGQWLADLTANRAVFDAATNPATQHLGKFTILIRGGENTDAAFPGGDGYGTAMVDASGRLTLAGSLADGSALAQTVPLSRTGDWSLYVPLYSGKGSALGWLTFDTNQPAGGLQGELSWIKPAQGKALLYPNGFTNLVMAAGSRYTSAVGLTNRIIPLTNGVLSLERGNLGAPLTNQITLSPAHQVIDTSLSNKLSLTLTLSSGVFKGSITPAGTTRRLPVQGAIFQDLGAGYGYFLGTNQSGRVYFGP